MLIRPTILRGQTSRVRTGHGNLYVTINRNTEDQVVELFATVGKSGEAIPAMLNSLARLVSLCLQSAATGAPVEVEKILDQLKGIRDAEKFVVGGALSIPDGIGRELERALKEGGDESGVTVPAPDSPGDPHQILVVNAVALEE